MSDKTGFTMINHSVSSLPANPEPFFFESEIYPHCCFMLLHFTCNRLLSTSNGIRLPLFLWHAAFLDWNGSAFFFFHFSSNCIVNFLCWDFFGAFCSYVCMMLFIGSTRVSQKRLVSAFVQFIEDFFVCFDIFKINTLTFRL